MSTVGRAANRAVVGHTESMQYVSRVPAPPLDRFIDDIYCLTGVPRHRRINIPPMPQHICSSIWAHPSAFGIRTLRAPPAVFTDGWFMGVWTRRFLVEYPPRVRLVGVHFKPCRRSCTCRGPSCETVGCRSTRSGNGRWTGFAIRSAASRRPPGHCRYWRRSSARDLPGAPSPGLDLVQRTGGLLEASHGAVAVGALTDAAWVSGNHLATQFKSHVGSLRSGWRGSTALRG